MIIMVAYGFPDPQKIRYEAVKDGYHERSLKDGVQHSSRQREEGRHDWYLTTLPSQREEGRRGC